MSYRQHQCYLILKRAGKPLTEKEVRAEWIGREASLGWDLNALVTNGFATRFKDGRAFRYEVIKK